MDGDELKKRRIEIRLFLAIRQAMEDAQLPIEYVKRLADPDFLREIGEVCDGQKEIARVDSMIDLDLDPGLLPLPSDWTCIGNQRFGKWIWNPDQLELYVSETQQNGRQVRGDKLVKWLKSRRTMNASLLDWLRRHPCRLPKTWSEWLETGTIFFLGTSYRDHDGHPCVRYLCLNQNGKPIWNYRKLRDYWKKNDAIVLMIP